MTLATRPPLPRFVQIEPVGECNLKCEMCAVTFRGEGGRGRPRAFLPYEDFCALLEQFRGVRELQLQGLGEPLLHPRFFDMVRAAAARGIEVATNSNLTALSPRRAEECVSSGLSRLHVSLDAADAPTFEAIRVGARLERVLRNLRLVLEARRRAASPTPRVGLVAVAMRRNLEHLPALVRLAAEYGADELSVQSLSHDFTEESLPARYAPMREYVERETLANEDPARARFWFGVARSEADSLGLPLRLPDMNPNIKGGNPRCNWPWNGAYVAYSGEAMPCCMVGTPDRASFGNMAREGVERVWAGEAYAAFRERLARGEPPAVCRGCSVWLGRF